MSRSEHTPLPPRIFAIVPAAGRSRRMGQAKQLLSVAGRPMLVAVVDSLRAGGVEHIVVVTHAEIAAGLGGRLPPGTLLELNDDPNTEMIDSIRQGITAWTNRVRIAPHDGFLVLPGDHPGISPPCIADCIAVFVHDPARIVVAAHQQRLGHPLIFPGALLELVRSSQCDSGLRELLRICAAYVRTVESADDAVIRDVDTPDDYRQLT